MWAISFTVSLKLSSFGDCKAVKTLKYYLIYSLDPGKVFLRSGEVSVVDLSGFYSYNKSETITDQDAQRFSAKLYADISLSYPDKTPRNPGDDNEFQVEQLGPAEWRYNVILLYFTST